MLSIFSDITIEQHDNGKDNGRQYKIFSRVKAKIQVSRLVVHLTFYMLIKTKATAVVVEKEEKSLK